MNFWQNAVVTDAGIALQSKIISGQTLKIVKAVTGAGTVPPVNLRQQTEVSSPKQEIRFLPASVKGDQITIPVVLENSGWNERYELWQVGLYAEDPDGGQVLYCLAQANEKKIIPAEQESPGFSITWNFHMQNSNEKPFGISIDPAGMATVKQYNIHTEAIEKLNVEVGDLKSLKTMQKKDLTGAVNEVKDEIGQVSSNLTKYLPAAGGRVSGNLYLDQGFNVFSSGSGSGSAGYLLLAEITVSGTYANSPIKLEICRRGDIFTTDIYIQFANDSGTNPSVYSFYYNNHGMKNINMYLYRNSASVWYLYVAKSEAYDNIAVLDVKKDMAYMSSVQVKYHGSYTGSVPSGSIKAIDYGDTGWVDCSMGNGISPHTGAYNRPQVRKIEKIVHLRGAVTNSTAWQIHNNIITIPAGFRPSGNENILQQGSGSNRYLLVVQTNGVCNAQRYTNNTTMNNTVPTGSWLCMHGSWFVE